MKTIGFIGLGIMGSRMAANLLKEGHQLLVYNRTPHKAQELIESGAIWGTDVEQVAKQSDILITMLSTPEVIEAMAKIIVTNLPKNALWINSSTIDPTSARTMGALSESHNIRYLDAPVAGTKGPAAAGELLFLIGGSTSDIEEAIPLFDCMGKKTIHLGAIGQGASIKLLINQLLGVQLVAFSEALTLGEAMGIEKDTLFDILTNTPVVPPVISAVRSKLENEDYEPNFPLKWIHKDLHLSSLSAYENGVALPHLQVTKEAFAKAKQEGLGDLDFTAIYKHINNN